MRYRVQQFNFHPNVFNMFFSQRLPMLLIPTSDNIESKRCLYSVADGRAFDLRLPVPCNNKCIGSSHGWLIFMDSISFVITLFNPFYLGHRKGTIKLPPFPGGREIFLSRNGRVFYPDSCTCKAVLSADPVSTSGYIVMLIYGELRRLACYKSRDESWTGFCGNYPPVFDIVLFKDRFLAVNMWGELLNWRDDGSPSRFMAASEPVNRVGRRMRRYIVVSDDGKTLFQVLRLISATTFGFVIYRLEINDPSLVWETVETIGDAALFLGDNYSWYVKASDFPNIIPNSIYFTDDYHEGEKLYCEASEMIGPVDTGVYHIGDASFSDHYQPNYAQNHLFPPIWILPTI